MESSPSLARDRKLWWMKNRKVLDKHLRDARSMIATQDPKAVAAAVEVLDAALAISPRLDAALELKARSLLFLHRFREVADMLQDYIPSYRVSSAAAGEDSSSSLSSSGSGGAASDCRERAYLLPAAEEGDRSFRCFSISDFKRKVIAGLHRGCDRQGSWKYLILGQACCHLGLLEDALVLLQTGRRLASAAFRHESISRTNDTFEFSATFPLLAATDSHGSCGGSNGRQTSSSHLSEGESVAHLLSHIKLLLRRRAAATAALDASLPNEAARHFSKIVEGRRGTPHPFAAACLVGRAIAFRDAGRITEAITDCNRALALDPSSIPALRARADLLESIRCLTDCLHDLDHLKLLYDAILRDRKLPGPLWRTFHYEVRYRDIPANLRALTARIHGIRQRVASGEGCDIDYYKLIGVRRGSSRSELEKAHLLLSLRHKPDKAGAFVDRLEFSDEHRDLDAVKDQARMSALILFRLLQKGYSSIRTTAIMEEAAAEKKQAAEAVAVLAAAAAASSTGEQNSYRVAVLEEKQLPVPPVYQGVFCRDMATVGGMLSRAIPVNYEALSC